MSISRPWSGEYKEDGSMSDKGCDSLSEQEGDVNEPKPPDPIETVKPPPPKKGDKIKGDNLKESAHMGTRNNTL